MRNEHNASIVICHRVKHAICACVVVLFSVLPISAQVYSTANNQFAAEQQMAQPQYQSYQSTVYQPFESSVPSDNHPVYGNSQGDNSRHNAPTNRRNLTGGGDPGNQSNQSPVGEAWVMLFFAAVAALFVYRRQRSLRPEDTPKIP